MTSAEMPLREPGPPSPARPGPNHSISDRVHNSSRTLLPAVHAPHDTTRHADALLSVPFRLRRRQLGLGDNWTCLQFLPFPTRRSPAPLLPRSPRGGDRTTPARRRSQTTPPPTTSPQPPPLPPRPRLALGSRGLVRRAPVRPPAQTLAAATGSSRIERYGNLVLTCTAPPMPRCWIPLHRGFRFERAALFQLAMTILLVRLR
jgi:hypothetical protein